MDKPQLNLEKPFKTNPTEKPHKSNKVSISAILFFIFICFFVIHFHPSPSTLFHNTKFWFFLSNVLIVIIAADSGAFSSSTQKYDLYEEYLKNSRSRNASSFVPPKIRPNSSIKTKHVIYEEPITNRKPIIASSFLVETPEDIIKGDLESEPPPESENSEIFEENTTVAGREEETLVEDSGKIKEIRRTKSEEAISVTGNENKRSLSRSVTEGHDHRTEENEFSAMSDEELNRRVEEFIRKFNRQMRLQETRSLGWLEKYSTNQ